MTTQDFIDTLILRAAQVIVERDALKAQLAQAQQTEQKDDEGTT